LIEGMQNRGIEKNTGIRCGVLTKKEERKNVGNIHELMFGLNEFATKYRNSHYASMVH
jgi:hypothetical protein